MMPDKAVSKKQFRLLKGISEGSIPAKGKLNAATAKEMLGGQTSTGLPERLHHSTPQRKRSWRFA